MPDDKREAIEHGRALLLEIGSTDEEGWQQNDKTFEVAAQLADALARLVGYPEYDDATCRTCYREPVEQACAVPVVPVAARAGEGTLMVDQGSYNKGVYDAVHGALPGYSCGYPNCDRCKAEAGKAQAEWLSAAEWPLEPGDTRLMAVEILRNGVPDWDVFVGTVSEEYEDEWSSESDDPGWTPSEVGYSMSIAGLPKLPPPSAPEGK